MERSKATTGEVLDDWLAVEKSKLAATTYGNYVSIVERRLRPHLGSVRIAELGPAHIARCLDALRQPGANGRGKDRTKPLSETSVLPRLCRVVLGVRLGNAATAHRLQPVSRR